MEKKQSKINFNSLEIIELSSQFRYLDENNNERPYTHVVGVIDRDLGNPIHNLSAWGKTAVVYDPWNMGSVFPANQITKLPYYKYGGWEVSGLYCFNRPDINGFSNKFKDKFNFYEKFMLATPLIGLKLEYIRSAFSGSL